MHCNREKTNKKKKKWREYVTSVMTFAFQKIVASILNKKNYYKKSDQNRLRSNIT